MEASTTTDPTFDQLIQLWETNKLQMPRQYLTKQLDKELNEAQKLQVCDLLQNAMMDVLKLSVTKMFHFNPNGYGQEYYVMAESKEKAHEYLIKFFEKEGRNDSRDFVFWNTNGYSIDEHEIGSVVHSENC